MQLRTVGLFVLLASRIPAQIPTHISPIQATGGVSGYGGALFFGNGPTAVVQQVHGLRSFANTSPATITRLRFRMALPNAAALPVDLELRMAVCPHDELGASMTFANNIVPSTEVVVFSRKAVLLPMVPDKSWSVPFAFDRPFTFSGNQHISWRALLYVHGGPNGGRYYLDAWSAQGLSVPLGPGCGGMQSSLWVGPPGGSVFLTCRPTRSFVPSPAIVSIGLSTTSFQGLGLPFDLSRLGAPGCLIVNDIVFAVPARGGVPEYSADIGLPSDRALENAGFYSQFLIFDRFANALGLVTSGSMRHAIPPSYGIATIGNWNDVNAATGFGVEQRGVAIGLN